MDPNASRLLSDKFYERRKQGALEVESAIRSALATNDSDRISKIVRQLCHDYAYSVHQPHARNGGLIGLAAAAIALGAEVPPYLSLIVPPVLACFSDQDARVRYYACESMYNIAKVAKGEILVYFNDVFDALCKLAADTELSVKNGAELLDRLVKDIVSESAATYASILAPAETAKDYEDGEDGEDDTHEGEERRAFSLPRFIPLLRERILVINPFTRTFLVSWITLLDSIPDLELVAHLPSFLGGLLKFLSDPNQDVHTTTKVALDRFLAETKKIALLKKGLAESRGRTKRKASGDSTSAVVVESPLGSDKVAFGNEEDIQRRQDDEGLLMAAAGSIDQAQLSPSGSGEAVADGGSSVTAATDTPDDDDDDNVSEIDDEYLPGQDVKIDHHKILDILLQFLSEETASEVVQLTILKWIETFLEICPEEMLVFTPRILAQVLPALSHDVDKVREAAGRVNQSLMGYVMSLPEDPARGGKAGAGEKEGGGGLAPLSTAAQAGASAPSLPAVRSLKETEGAKVQSTTSLPTRQPARKPTSPEPVSPSPQPQPQTPTIRTPEPPPTESERPPSAAGREDLDYEAAVNALTLQFLHEHEATRVAALAWLIMLHRKSPRKILAIQDATFPALLKTLSDPAEAVVTRDLLLLSQISKSSDDISYFSSFMINLLKLFATDRRLLETRGNLIIRQLCLSLSAEKIYRTMADFLEQEEDIEFASIMVQNLNNNLITAPELADLRKRLRNLDSPHPSNPSSATASSGTSLFVVLYKAWTVNAIATISLCLLAQAYEQAYHLLQVFGSEIEMTVTMLIQIDKLVQLLESPVFTYLRMQLLEPERFPYLYKCLYGLLMLLPQSSAFAALKNRLQSVSAIGYLHMVPPSTRTPGSAGAASTAGQTASVASSFETRNRLTQRPREGEGIKWTELLDKFKTTQERVRRAYLRQQLGDEAEREGSLPPSVPASPEMGKRRLTGVGGERPESALSGRLAPQSAPAAQIGGMSGGGKGEESSHRRHKSGLSQLGRLAGRSGKGKK